MASPFRVRNDWQLFSHVGVIVLSGSIDVPLKIFKEGLVGSAAGNTVRRQPLVVKPFGDCLNCRKPTCLKSCSSEGVRGGLYLMTD